MGRWFPVWMLAFLLTGCSFQRSDFVCGSDGRPARAPSPSGRILGAFLGGIAQGAQQASEAGQ
jgi:hypothetical protein